MTVQTVNATPANFVPTQETAPPDRPPKPELDDLDGHLEAYLAQTVKPHRERLADIMSVIDGTDIGKALLDHFRDRAKQNNALVVNLLPAGTPLPEGAAALGLWVNEAELTAGAQQIGVSPEVQYAPSVFQGLVLARNASLGQLPIGNAGPDDNGHAANAAKDLANLLARFQQESADRHDGVVWRPASGDPAHAQEQARLAAEAITQKAQALRLVPTDPKPGANAGSPNGNDIAAAAQPPIPDITVSSPSSGKPGFDAAAVVPQQGRQRIGSAPAALTGLDGASDSRRASTGSVHNSPGPVPVEVTNNGAPGPSGLPMVAAQPSDKGSNVDSTDSGITPASKVKKRWPGRVTQWVDKRFQGLVDIASRLRQRRGHEIVSQQSGSRSNSVSSTGSSTAKSEENKPV